MQIEKSGRGNARTESGTPSSHRSLLVPAAARLNPDVPIKALDPVGLPYCVLLLKATKLRKYFVGGRNLSANHISPKVQNWRQSNWAEGFDAAKWLQVDGFTDGI
jgi:hypothetical protein